MIRRPWLVVKGILTDRDRPNLDRLRRIDDPERFVWAMLPHAARSFAPSILLLPEDAARASAVAYLYARMLDSYEDLASSPESARRGISAFVERLEADRPGPAPVLAAPLVRDARDEAHLLLIERHPMVDQVYMGLPAPTRARVRRLIEDMGDGMIEFSHIFERQGGLLVESQQVVDYCHRVIGLPALFVMETTLTDVTPEQHRQALEVSELVQLANITRDVEKDLRVGVAYHPILKPHLGSEGGAVAATEVSKARRDLMRLATRRAASFRHLVDAARLPLLSPARAGAVLMMLFTDRHYRECAASLGLPGWAGPSRVVTMMLVCFPAAVSRSWANRLLLRAESGAAGGMSFLIDGFDHIVLGVLSVDRTVAFYRDCLNMEPVEQRPGKWALRFGDQMISLQPADDLPEKASRTAPGTGNFCVVTSTPVAEIAPLLVERGIEIIEGPAAKSGAIGPIESIYFYDPDGNLVEIANRV